MSNLEADLDTSGENSSQQVLLPREVPLGGPRALMVRRTLPHRSRRMIGPWCFIDHYGPVSHATMDVPPHPHTGLQTVSWLLSGAIHHTDSLGFSQEVKPGQLNLMTAGRAIAHAEIAHDQDLHGVQLWVALPESHRDQSPHFEHHNELPVVELPGSRSILLMGEFAGSTSPAATYWPTIGAEITLTSATTTLPLNPAMEYGVLALTHNSVVNNIELPKYALVDLGSSNSSLTITSEPGALFMLIGGAHFNEEIVMWWNFIGRSHEEIEIMRKEWQEGIGYSEVEYDGDRLAAPAMPSIKLKARGA